MDKHIVPELDIANQDKSLKSFSVRTFSAERRERQYMGSAWEVQSWHSPVMKASGMLAASTQDSCGGLRRICVSGTAINSA
jgi:hypothetical protein